MYLRLLTHISLTSVWLPTPTTRRLHVSILSCRQKHLLLIIIIVITTVCWFKTSNSVICHVYWHRCLCVVGFDVSSVSTENRRHKDNLYVVRVCWSPWTGTVCYTPHLLCYCILLFTAADDMHACLRFVLFTEPFDLIFFSTSFSTGSLFLKVSFFSVLSHVCCKFGCQYQCSWLPTKARL